MRKFNFFSILVLLYSSVGFADLEVQTNDSYKLQIGDQLRLSIYAQEDTDRTVTIDGFGDLQYLILGTIHAQGRTIDDLKGELNQKIKAFYEHGMVNVIPISFESQNFNVLGEVQNPGSRPLKGKTMLSEAMSYCGASNFTTIRGKPVEAADLRHAFVVRNGTLLPVNIYELIVNGDMSQDLELADDDSIFIPKNLSRRVAVLGEVHCPGNFPYTYGMTVKKAIGAAGGANREEAPDWAYVYRGSFGNQDKIIVNLQDLLNDRIADLPLQPNDLIYMPKRSNYDPEQVEKMAIQAFVRSPSYTRFISEREAVEAGSSPR